MPTLAELMAARGIPMPSTEAPKEWEPAEAKGTPVRDSRDLQRILALPRREPLVDLRGVRAQALVEHVTAKYANGVPTGRCRCREYDPQQRWCITTLLPAQAWALHETGLTKGCFAGLAVGFGKTLLDILSIYPLGVETALALIPANLVSQFWDNYRCLGEHFRVPSVTIYGLGRSQIRSGEPMLYVLPYSLLQRPEYSDKITQIAPQAIIADEGDKLNDLRASATARRVLYYFVTNPTTRCCVLTGTPTDRKLAEYAHLLVMCLGDGAPVPQDPREVASWGEALDAAVTDMRRPTGALRSLLTSEEREKGLRGEELLVAVRRGFQRRLADTLGVVLTGDDTVEVADSQGHTIQGTSVEVVIRERKAPPIPLVIQEALQSAREFVRPDSKFGAPRDEPLDSPLERAEVIAQIASGVMYKWTFPPINGVPQERATVERWYDWRYEYHKEVRKLCVEGTPHLDSPKLCQDAAKRGWGQLPERDDRPSWKCWAWPEWDAVRGLVKPVPVAVRLHRFLAEDAAHWALEHRGIVWYDLVEFGAWVAELAELPLHGGGPKAPARLKAERGDRSVVASISSHGRGRNGLQIFAEQLVTQLPSSTRRWGQLLGRLKRRGQQSSMVLTEIYLHVPELEKTVKEALARAEYVEQTTGMAQSLLKAWKLSH